MMESIGPWVLLAAGIALLAGAVATLLRASAQAGVLALALVFGTALSGTGVFGLQFLREFGDFLRTTKLLESVASKPGPETYTAAVDAVASGKVRAPYDRALVTYLVEHPVPELGALLQSGAERATHPAGAQALRAGGERLAGKTAAANQLTESLAQAGQLRVDQVARFDPGTRSLIAARVDRARWQPLPGPAVNATEAHAIVDLGRTRAGNGR